MRSTRRGLSVVFTGRCLLGASLILQLALVPVARAGEPSGLFGAIKRASSCLVNAVSDRIAVLRGYDCTMTRSEQAYQQGDPHRALNLLGKALSSSKLTDTQRADALYAAGTIQTQLGDHGQAVRAFAGMTRYRQDYQPPSDATDDLRRNMDAGAYMASLGSTSEVVATQVRDAARPSLLNRAQYAWENITDGARSAVTKNTLLCSLAAKTVGRLNVWRATRTLERFGIPRLKVIIEPDDASYGSGWTRADGVVAIDQTATLSYADALDVLAHEGHHVTATTVFTPEFDAKLKKYDDASRKIEDLEKRLTTSKEGSSERQQLNQELDAQRAAKSLAKEDVQKEWVKEEAEADRFAGFVTARVHLPLMRGAWYRSARQGDKEHPAPADAARYFMDGAAAALEEVTGVKDATEIARERLRHEQEEQQAAEEAQQKAASQR